MGEGFIECHHTVPLAEGGERVSRLSELALCANCHRMIHRSKPFLQLDEIRELYRP
ncbi:MAG: hypothetical protein R2695_19445 [Acidimicrobiales bacterium]